MDMEIISAAEAKRMFPLLEEQYFIGALFDRAEGHVDPTGVTRAYAGCARQAGAEICQHTWVSDLRQRPDGTWDVITDSGEIHAEHIVNAGGLWAREVGRMIGLELPVLAMEHMYLITEDMDEVAEYNAAAGHELPMDLDFDGELYIRQEGGGMLLGTYEQACVPWSPRETPWTFDQQLLAPDLDRIAPSLEIAFKHYPALADVGIRKVINGPFTFAPDGNPLVGPVPGVRNCWMACAVTAGFSQGGGVGLTLARWMVDGDPGEDIWAMDVARFGNWASLAYTNAKVRENYSRRFRITFPNEELPAGRALHTTPVYDRLTAHNAVWGASFGLEHPLWFQRPGEEPREDVTFRRSNAYPVVADECTMVRERVGLTECSNFAKYRVTGAGSADWLQRLFTNRLPRVGRINLTAALDPNGHIVGEFSVARVGTDDFFLFGSQVAEAHHSRWFLGHLADGVGFDVLGLSLVGLSLAGSKDELVVAALRRAAEIQQGVEGRWRRQVPHLSTAELQRRWWRWINRSPERLALVRLGLEAATLDATVSGLPGDVRAEQISFWRDDIADGLIADGIRPEDAEREASLVRATFTGLVLDLLATGHRKRLTEALECALSRLDDLSQTAP